jgi:hypothetical protein
MSERNRLVHMENPIIVDGWQTCCGGGCER